MRPAARLWRPIVSRLSWFPVPGIGAGHLEPGATLTDWVDRQLLPGRLHRTVRDPEGITPYQRAHGDARYQPPLPAA